MGLAIQAEGTAGQTFELGGLTEKSKTQRSGLHIRNAGVPAVPEVSRQSRKGILTTESGSPSANLPGLPVPARVPAMSSLPERDGGGGIAKGDGRLFRGVPENPEKFPVCSGNVEKPRSFPSARSRPGDFPPEPFPARDYGDRRGERRDGKSPQIFVPN